MTFVWESVSERRDQGFWLIRAGGGSHSRVPCAAGVGGCPAVPSALHSVPGFFLALGCPETCLWVPERGGRSRICPPGGRGVHFFPPVCWISSSGFPPFCWIRRGLEETAPPCPSPDPQKGGKGTGGGSQGASSPIPGHPPLPNHPAPAASPQKSGVQPHWDPPFPSPVAPAALTQGRGSLEVPMDRSL